MNDNFSEQKEKLLALNKEISLLHQQVNYLLRNEKPLGLLDLDVLMNRTHTVYDMLCSIQLNGSSEEEDLNLDVDAFAGLFGGLSEQEERTGVEAEEEEENPEVEANEEKISEEVVAPVEVAFEEVAPEVVAPEEIALEEVAPEEETLVEEPSKEETETASPESDEFGLFFRFEDEPQDEPQEEANEEPLFEPQVEPQLELQTVEFEDKPIVTEEGKVVHFVEEVPEEDIPARDLVNGDELQRDNPFEMPRMEDGSEEVGFELTTQETLGESLMHEDHSLAARLQQNPVRDLKSVIGINDKFLFVNELFGGSMEKYNKSIENLNDLKTLNGAMIYLNELKVELQWNSSNEAYQKLTELVHRKFD